MIRESPNENLTILHKDDVSKLNGRFSNNPSSSKGLANQRYPSLRDSIYETKTLWSQIRGVSQGRNTDSSKSQTVTLEFISDRKAKAKLWEGEEVMRTKKIRGKIKDGYFYRRPYFTAVPLIPLVFKYKTFRYRIGLTGNEIVVDYRWNYWGAVIFGGYYASKGQSKCRFSKK